MKVNFLFATIIISSVILFSACSSSLVFSPGVNLPVKTLEKSQVDVQGGVELFPETRPEGIMLQSRPVPACL